MAGTIILVEAWPRRIADGVAQVVRLAGGGSAAPYRYGGQRWRAGIAALPTIIAGLAFDGDNLGAGAIPQALEIAWASTRAADLTDLASDYLWPDAAVTVRVGPEGALPPVVLTGKVVDTSSADGQLRIILADPAAALRLPILTDRFTGAGGVEGPVEWNGRIKNRVWGRVWNAEGEPIYPASNIYCFADPRRPLAAIDTVRDSGAPAAALTTVLWQGSVDATWAALLAAAAPQGGGVVAPSIACVKWWTEPAGTLTADLRGEIGTGYVETAPEIAARIVEARSGPAFAAGAVAAAKLLRPSACGVLVDGENDTIAAVLDDLLGGVSLIWRLDTTGTIDFRTWSWTAPVATARSHSITRRNTFKPIKSRKIGYRTNQTVMSRGDIAGIVFAGDITFADGTPLEDLKPAEIDATKGAIIPSPGSSAPGNVVDENGVVRNSGELLNIAIQLAPAGRLSYRPAPDAPPVELGQIMLDDIGAVSTAAFRRAEDDIDQLARALATALDEASSTRATFRDAGFYDDPATGQVRIHAIEQTKERVSTAEIRLSAAEASIRLRATTSYVNEQIALAVIDPSQVAELTDLILRLGAAEVDIDGLNATVTTLATVTELSLVEGRVTTAEEAIDALEGTITTKVDTTTFDLLATRVTNAETILTAIGDSASIVNAVSAIRLIDKAQQDNDEADLRALLLGDETRREQVAAVAAARQELTARIIEGDAAEAAFRLALQVRVGAAEASLASESLARASGDAALVFQITQLAANLTTTAGTLQTNINNANQARIDGDAALASSIATLSASLDTGLENLAAAVDDEAQARVEADGLIAAGLAQQVTAGRVVEGQASELADLLLASLLKNDENRRELNGAVAGARQEITAQIVSEVEALSTRILALVARVAGNEASFISEQIARVAADESIVASVEQLESQFETDTATLNAAIINEQIARTNAVQSLATSITNLNASFTGQLSAEATARTNAIAAEATTRAQAISAETAARTNSVNTLTNGLNNALGRLDDEELARLQGDQAEADARAAALTEEANARTAAINSEANARIAAIQAEANARGTALTAEENARIAAINAERQQTLADVAAERQARESAVTTLTASISNEAIARANADGALAGQISTLTTTVGNQSATLTQFASSISGLQNRWGVKFDNNGRVTGFVLNGSNQEATADWVVDRFRLIHPASGFVYFQATESGVKMSNVEVDTLKAGIVSASRMSSAAMGETAFTYIEPAVSTNGFNWVNVVSVGMTPVNGRPTKLMFSALIRDITDANTIIKVRIIRDDGAIIYGESARRTGAHLNITDEGVPVCIPIIDTVAAGRATTWTLQMAKVNEQNVVCEASFRFAQAEELSRVNTQSSTITLGGGTGGEPGPGVPITNPPGGSNPIP